MSIDAFWTKAEDCDPEIKAVNLMSKMLLWHDSWWGDVTFDSMCVDGIEVRDFTLIKGEMRFSIVDENGEIKRFGQKCCEETMRERGVL